MKQKSLWSFGTREVVFSAIGIALYAGFSYLTNIAQIPGAGNVSFRPAVVIPMFFGVAFGPIVGFLTGAFGNFFADLLSGYGVWIWWDLGNGIMGLIPGLVALQMVSFRSGKEILTAEIAVVVGAFLGMALASISELWVSGIDFATVVTANFTPAFITNIINGLVLMPILMLAYSAVLARSGR